MLLCRECSTTFHEHALTHTDYRAQTLQQDENIQNVGLNNDAVSESQNLIGRITIV